ncbi:MAG TPA: FtsX-like permease family protein [Steroidobacteraceae bacterium]|nr:FtsX-like permease family protein [Steroidobacteraceae bacterium]
MARARHSSRHPLWAASLRHLLRHPAQGALALVGLALGVATIVAVDIATDSARRAFELSVAAVSGPATHEIVGGPAGIDEQLYARWVREYPSLAFAPLVEGYATVADRVLDLLGIDPLAASGGLDRGPSPGLGELSRWLTQPGAVILAASTADGLGIAPGGRFELEIAGHAVEAVLLARAGGRQEGRENLLLTDIAQAQEWLGLIGRLSRIEVRCPPGPDGNAALARLRAALPAGLELQSAQQGSLANLDTTRAFTTDLTAMSMLALLVGMFLIYNAVSFAVLQRRPTFAVLRAIGARRGDILRLVLAEAALLGVAGGLCGLAAGIVLARGLLALVTRTINDLYFVVAVNAVALSWRAVLAAICAGVLSALAAALLPAWEATQVSPQLGLRRSALESRALRASHALVAVSALAAAAAIAIVVGSSRNLLAGFAALFLLLLSAAALTPAFLRVSARGLGRLLASGSPLGRLALAEIAASLSRTGVAVAALALALAAMLGVSVMIESFRESLRDWLDRTMRADVYVSAPGPGISRPERRLDPRVIAAIERLPGIAHASASRRVSVSSARGPITVDALAPAPESLAAIDVRASRGEVWPAFAHGAILVAEPLAWRLQLRPGDRLSLGTARGPRSFDIAGIYREYGNDRGGVLMDRAIYARDWDDDSITTLGLYLAPGARLTPVLAAVRAAAAGHQALLIAPSAEVRALSMEIFEQTFAITRVIDWLTAAVAAIGLASSLSAWQLERSRTLAVLRTLGLTPRGAALLVEAQTAFMGLVALVAAVPAGLLAADWLVTVINRRAFGWQLDFHLRAVQLADALALALAAALVAGLYPAWRSARAALAVDIREE